MWNLRTPRVVAIVCLCCLLGHAVPANAWQIINGPPQPPPTSLVERIQQHRIGEELFVRDWSKSDVPRQQSPDGLGPMFNDVSCVACHKQEQGGVGGGGPPLKNVRLLHLMDQQGSTKRTATQPAQSVLKARARLHPEMRSGATTVVLHRHQQRNGKDFEPYQTWLARRLPSPLVLSGPLRPNDMSLAALIPNSPAEAVRIFHVERFPVRVTERNTTALFGAGLIDSISDADIVAVAKRQKKDHGPLISGRVPQTATAAIGRFGWRGQISSLQEFVMTACAVEVGLNVPAHSQAEAVLTAEGKLDLPSNEKLAQQALDVFELDLTQKQCDALTMYVSSLPQPITARANSLDHAKNIERGERRFQQIGCAICHLPQVGSVAGIYSDLLLHDMGPGLSDPLPAVPEINEQTVPGGITSGYFGATISLQLVKNITTNIHQEWRTPPLWGVADSAPYLHDGRAVSLEEAIRYHGGEAQRSAEAFRALKPNEQDELLGFLDSLAAPSDQPKTVFDRRTLRRGMFGFSGQRGSGGGFF